MGVVAVVEVNYLHMSTHVVFNATSPSGTVGAVRTGKGLFSGVSA